MNTSFCRRRAIQIWIVISSLVVATCLAKPASAGDSFSIKETDKQLHMAVSYGGALTVTRFLETKNVARWKSVLYASALVLLAGTAKETLIDSHYSSGDQIANVIGTSASALVVFTFEL